MKCNSKGIDNPALILDNARIYHARNLVWDSFTVLYVPSYCLFLNPMENCFSKWKNIVIRRACTTETQLKQCIENSSNCIKSEDCAGYYRNMLRYLNMSANKEDINN